MNDDVLTAERSDLRGLFGLPPESKPQRAPAVTPGSARPAICRRPQIDWTVQQRQFFQGRMP